MEIWLSIAHGAVGCDKGEEKGCLKKLVQRSDATEPVLPLPSELGRGSRRFPQHLYQRSTPCPVPPKTGFSITLNGPVELRQIPAPLWTSVSRSVKCRRGITSISKSFRSWVKGPGGPGVHCPEPPRESEGGRENKRLALGLNGS